jgi:hypothetical protein
MLLCVAPVVIPQIEKPKQLVNTVKGFTPTSPAPPGGPARV